MEINWNLYLKGWQLNEGASDDLIRRSTLDARIEFPSDYILFIRNCNGGEGFIGNNYIIIWKIDELKNFNEEYEVNKYARGIFLFGSNGGGEGYGFDLNVAGMPIVEIPFIGMERKYAKIFAPAFLDIFKK